MGAARGRSFDLDLDREPAATIEWQAGTRLRGEAALAMNDGERTIPVTLRFDQTEFEQA